MAQTATSTKSARPASIWNRTFICLCFVNLFQIMGQMMMMTIMPLYARELGVSASMIGFIVGAFAISALIIRPFAAPAIDSFRKKPFMYVGLPVMALCCFLYGVADSVPALIAVRMLHGCAMGCTGPVALSLVTESLPLERMASGISIFSLAQALSQAIGPATGLALIDIVGYQWTFRLAAISLLFSFGLFFLVKENPSDNRPPYRLYLSRMFAKEALVPATLTLIVTAANTSIMSFLTIYAELRGVESIGLYFTVQACCVLATRPLFGKLADRLGYSAVIIPALVVYACAFIIISQATTLWMFLLAAVICACGFGVCQPLMQAQAMASVPRSRSGAASSTNFTGLDIAVLVGPTCAGSVAESLGAQLGSEVDGYSTMYLWVIAIVVVAIVFLAFTRKYIKRNIERATAIDLEEKL